MPKRALRGEVRSPSRVVAHPCVEGLLHRSGQAVDFVDKKHVPGLEVGEDGRQISGALQGGPRGDAELPSHFPGDDPRQRGLPQPRGAVEQNVVQGLTSQPRRRDVYGQFFPEAFLANKVSQGLRAKGQILFVCPQGGMDQSVIGHDLFLLSRSPTPAPISSFSQSL